MFLGPICHQFLGQRDIPFLPLTHAWLKSRQPSAAFRRDGFARVFMLKITILTA